MAYLPYDQDNPLLQPRPPGSGAPSSGGSSAGQVGAAPQTQTDSGSNYPNLTAYLAANASNGQTLGQGIADQINQDAATATREHVPTTNWWVTGHPDAAANPLQIRDTDESFQGTYAPDEVAQAKATQQEIANIGTPEGRQAILDQRFGSAGTQGGSQLDSLLLGAYGMAPLQSASARWSDPIAAVAGYTWTRPASAPGVEKEIRPTSPLTGPKIEKPAQVQQSTSPFAANGGIGGYGGDPARRLPSPFVGSRDYAANGGASGYGIPGAVSGYAANGGPSGYGGAYASNPKVKRRD